MQIVYPRYFLFPVIMKDDLDFVQDEKFRNHYREIENDTEVFSWLKASYEDVFEELDEEFIKKFFKY